MRVSIAVRYKSGSRFLVQGIDGSSPRVRRTGARGDEVRGRDVVRRDVRMRIWEEGFGEGLGATMWMDDERDGVVLRLWLRMR